MLLAERELLVGAQTPRIHVVPDGDEHPRWGEVLEMLDRLGMELDPWQLDVLWTSLLRRGDMWAAFTVAVCAPRQNGKNEILQARELAGALILGERLIIHSAHLADTCMESFMRLDDLIDSNDWLLSQVRHVRRTNGRESVQFVNGSRIRFRTRTRGGGRGFSGSPVVFDEPMFFPVISQNAILPVLSAQPDPQAWYTGSAVDESEHEDGIVFARVRERALRGEDDRLAYFEFSLPYDSPEDVTDEIAGDVGGWAATNPALGIRITQEYIAAEREELGSRGFAVERLGVGAWPRTDDVSESPIDFETWVNLASAEARPVGNECIIFDVSPERRSAIISVSATVDGRLLIEVLASEDGTAWVPDRLVELSNERVVEEFACDEKGPGASVAALAEDAGLIVRRFDSAEHAEACGMMVDWVSEGLLVHHGNQELTDAVRRATTRPLVDAWAWSRKNSSVDIKTLVAATLGVKSAIDRDIVNTEIHIY